MSATVSRPNPRPTPKGAATRPEPAGPDGPLPHAVEGAAAALCAVIAMVVVSALALSLLDAGSVGSLGSLTAAVTVLAVGGSLSAGPDMSGAAESSGSGLAGLFGGGGGMSPAMSGSAAVTPLGVTLVGAVVLWFVFSRRLRHHRFDAGELAARAAGAGGAALFALVVLAGLAKGTITLPASLTDRGEGGGGLGGSGSGGMLGRLLGGGGAGAASEPTMTYHVGVGSVALGALVWVAVALGVGCVISRRVKVPLGGVTDRLRPGWAPGLSAIVRMLLLMAAVAQVAVAFVGLVVGGRASMAAGAALLLAPNAVAVLLSLGVGGSWTASTEAVRSEGGNPLSGLLGALGGGERPVEPDRHEQLRELSVGGLPLWLVALVVTGLSLVACAFVASRHADPRHMRPLHPYRGRFSPHLGLAERFGLGTAVVLGAACAAAEMSGRFSASMFGSEMGGKQAQLDGSLPTILMGGLVAGAAAGLVGSLLYRAMTPRPRILPRKTPPAPSGLRNTGPGSGPEEVPVAHR
ncbi:streptophobe family protein [Streptomyces caniscabiei]|uniref:streptophobe family protein n=2 Tax=Streptomyces caniscabiei TaxID=2746961 RepID=UPI0029B69115|nr:streptophobe family protein [Streptomyces caniscabiei]MDX2604451.1 streptophobe family protein [Streptomyces caniscabiei]MDX2735793.1 streptophobe family protein [Streptomyces caniscabiei]